MLYQVFYLISLTQTIIFKNLERVIINRKIAPAMF